jgi:hypothetical protein
MTHPLQLIVIACFVLSTMVCSNARAQSASEYSIKAGYLLLFTRYVQWPAQVFENEGAPINICILGEDPFGAVLDRTVEGQRSQNRPLRVHRLENTEDAGHCHVAFISAQESDNEAQWLANLAGRPILTIGEDSTALESGCVLIFVSEEERGHSRIRFDASFPAMRAASLKISSQMLVAARKVHRVPGA